MPSWRLRASNNKRSMKSSPGASASAGANSHTQKLFVTPENVLVGKVAFVNPTARFVVLNCAHPFGRDCHVLQNPLRNGFAHKL